jgi:predicted 3-demethylubiquinone-9 3-methyltransferase (glyoxalase superfamily)
MTKADMQKLTPNIWFNNDAERAAQFYASVFGNASVGDVSRYDRPNDAASWQGEESVLTVAFEIEGTKFMGLNGGPQFRPNPSISFLVLCDTKEEADGLWANLSQDGSVLMELGKYPFSEHYGWTADTYDVSWQLMLADDHYPFRHKVTPTLMFVGDVCGLAEDAMQFYASVFPESKVGDIARYPAGMEPDKEGTVMHGAVTLAGQEFSTMDSARTHRFSFNEGVSFIIDCEQQREIDYFWDKLTADGGTESMCGWCKDKYGVSWQVIPRTLPRLIKNESAMQAMLQMKRIVLADLEKALEGE